MFEDWRWKDDARGGARAREALVGVCVVSALVVGGLLVRLVAMGRRERRGTFESTRRRRRRGGDAAREGRVGRSDA
jgi:hypothetical protein